MAKMAFFSDRPVHPGSQTRLGMSTALGKSSSRWAALIFISDIASVCCKVCKQQIPAAERSI